MPDGGKEVTFRPRLAGGREMVLQLYSAQAAHALALSSWQTSPTHVASAVVREHDLSPALGSPIKSHDATQYRCA